MKRHLLPQLKAGEEIILQSQGGYVNNLHSAWKLGHIYLTDRRLFFFQPNGIVFDAPLQNIVEVRRGRRRYAFREKDVIFIAYRHDGAGKILHAWIIMAELERWRQAIYEKTSLLVDEEKIEKVMENLDPAAGEILWHVWTNRHARIDELAEVSGADAHMDVLLKIKEKINPEAEKVIGASILVFEKLKVDEGTGEKVGYSWWISGRRQDGREGDTIVDIFDEGERINLIIEMPGAKEGEIDINVSKERVVVYAPGTTRDYYEEVSLEKGVNPESVVRKFNNGILQVSMEKEKILSSGFH